MSVFAISNIVLLIVFAVYEYSAPNKIKPMSNNNTQKLLDINSN